MNDREKLFNMIIWAYPGISHYWAGVIADHLLKKGVKPPQTDGGNEDVCQ